jgi:hypothetical protein
MSGITDSVGIPQFVHLIQVKIQACDATAAKPISRLK